jgi:hypothetical protein
MPLRMSPPAMERAIFDARRRFNTLSSILRRALDPRANARGLARFVIFLIANLVNRREIYRKQGLRLG